MASKFNMNSQQFLRSSSLYRSWNYDWKPLLAEKPWKIVVLSRVGETRFEESDHFCGVPKEHYGIEYRYSRIADILQLVEY